MRSISVGTGERLKLTPDQRTRLKNYLIEEHKNAEEGSFAMRNTLRRAIRSYQGENVDEPDSRWKPFTGAPRIELTIAAEICDAILSQAQDLIFQVKPPLLSRSRKEEFDDAAAAIQKLVDWGVESGSWNFEQGTIRGMIDQIQGGWVLSYIPFTKSIRVTDARKVVTLGPRISVWPQEHVILPTGADKDIQQCKFITIRTMMSKNDLKLRARLNNWTIDDATGSDADNIVEKDRRSAAGLRGGGAQKSKVQVGQTWCYFDLNGDGIEADMCVTWNMLTGGIMKASYNQYNYRPFVLECYQDRAHTYAGIGCPEMVLEYQRAASEIVCNHIWNMEISNTKVYSIPSTLSGEVIDIYPGKQIETQPGEKVEAIDMGEVNATGIQAVSLILGMARERVGVTNLSAPVRSSSRTPGISMLSMLQQANRRFTHPFNNMRNLAGQNVMHCLYRIQEQVLGGENQQAMIDKLETVLGEEDAALVVNLMKRSDVELSDALDIQCVVSSVSVNRETDKQNLIMLMTQIIPLYWNAKKEIAQFMMNPQFEKTAKDADRVLDKLYDKVLKTFDQVSDTRSLHISLEDIHVAQNLDQMMQQMQGPGAAPPANGAAPQGPPAGTPLR